jgi:hypothetical protein
MSKAVARVLELFLQTERRGVTDVTRVTGGRVTCRNPLFTPVTSATYGAAQDDAGACYRNVTKTRMTAEEFEERAAII